MKSFAVLSIGLLAANAAFADVVVIANSAAGGISKDQIADIYLGKDSSLTPIDQPESAAIRAEFYKKATGRDLSQVKATWSRLTFSGKAQPPKEVADAAAVKKAVAADPKAIGYIDKSAVDGSVKVVATLD